MGRRKKRGPKGDIPSKLLADPVPCWGIDTVLSKKPQLFCMYHRQLFQTTYVRMRIDLKI